MRRFHPLEGLTTIFLGMIIILIVLFYPRFPEGWKLLDFVLLYELVESVRQMLLDRYSKVIGYNTFRRLLGAKNGHRSSYVSPTLKERREKLGLNAPINELEEFTQLYEPRFLKRSFLEELKRESRTGLKIFTWTGAACWAACYVLKEKRFTICTEPSRRGLGDARFLQSS